LRAEKRDLQEKNEELAKELKEYKAGFLEAGLTFEIVEEEVDVDEEAKWLTTIYLSYRFIVA
jgi:hypothetical protein